jgi:adenosylcobyric acid synthase
MMGRRIADPHHIESDVNEVVGLGLLDIETIFEGDKITARVEGVHRLSGLAISGYEIHCGRVHRFGDSPAFRIHVRGGRALDEPEGTYIHDGRLLGTSIHGLFDAPEFRRHFLNKIRKRKGFAPREVNSRETTYSIRAKAYDRLAKLLQAHLDVPAIAALLGVSPERLGRVADRRSNSEKR